MLLALIVSLIGRFRSNALFRRCLVEGASDIEVFEYEGLLYDRQRFIQYKAADISSMKWKELTAALTEFESGLVNDEQPDLALALIDAYKLALAQKKVPRAFR